MRSSARLTHGRPTRERAERAVQRSARALEADGAVRAALLAALVSIALGAVVAAGMATLVFYSDERGGNP